MIRSLPKLGALALGSMLLASSALAQGLPTVGAYKDTTGKPQQGVGITCLSGCSSAVGAATTSTPISVSTAATTQLVAASAGKVIYVSHFDVIAAGTTNVTLEYGTGTNCGTGATVLTGPYNLTAQTGISAGNGGAPLLFIPASNALCLVNSAAVQVSGAVSYAQQ